MYEPTTMDMHKIGNFQVSQEGDTGQGQPNTYSLVLHTFRNPGRESSVHRSGNSPGSLSQKSLYMYNSTVHCKGGVQYNTVHRHCSVGYSTCFSCGIQNYSALYVL